MNKSARAPLSSAYRNSAAAHCSTHREGDGTACGEQRIVFAESVRNGVRHRSTIRHKRGVNARCQAHEDEDVVGDQVRTELFRYRARLFVGVAHQKPKLLGIAQKPKHMRARYFESF